MFSLRSLETNHIYALCLYALLATAILSLPARADSIIPPGMEKLLPAAMRTILPAYLIYKIADFGMGKVWTAVTADSRARFEKTNEGLLKLAGTAVCKSGFYFDRTRFQQEQKELFTSIKSYLAGSPAGPMRQAIIRYERLLYDLTRGMFCLPDDSNLGGRRSVAEMNYEYCRWCKVRAGHPSDKIVIWCSTHWRYYAVDDALECYRGINAGNTQCRSEAPCLFPGGAPHGSGANGVTIHGGDW